MKSDPADAVDVAFITQNGLAESSFDHDSQIKAIQNSNEADIGPLGRPG